MNCVERERTLAWIGGEGNDAHAVHVSGCVDCSQLLTLHEEVGFALRKVEIQAPVLVRARPPRIRWGWLVLAAAVVVIGFGYRWTAVVEPIPSVDPVLLDAEGFDEDIDDLEAEIAAIEEDFDIL